MCISPPWIFSFDGFSAVSDLEITRGIRSDLEGPLFLWCLQHFRRSLRSGRKIFSIASVRTGVSILSDIFGDIRSCRRVFERLNARLALLLFGGYWSSQSSPWLLRFSKVLGRTAPRLRATSREVWFLHSFVLVSIWRRFQRSDSLLFGGISSVAVFPHLLNTGITTTLSPRW